MRILSVSDTAIAEAGRIIRAGGLVAFPTETVYGLGADATNARAVAGIYAAKGRPSFNPLIVHVADVTAARAFADMTSRAERLAAAFWPGPLTLVLVRRAGAGIADIVTAGLDTVAVRVPSSDIAHRLLVEAGAPVAAPSANRSGHVSATEAGHVASDLGAMVDLIIDGGPTRHGLESTIVDVAGAGAVLLRPGAVTREMLEAALGEAVVASTGDASRPSAPGQLTSHYAPRARVRLGAIEAEAGEALLAFGPDAPAHDGPTINLSPAGDLVEAAANLFTALRALDQPHVSSIAVMDVPGHGLGVAIADRLRRAAAER
ncbi:MAG: L-threonylcarbamoyladenylate synthase [Hyphomicrobiaceae bacterium]